MALQIQPTNHQKRNTLIWLFKKKIDERNASSFFTMVSMKMNPKYILNVFNLNKETNVWIFIWNIAFDEQPWLENERI